MNTFLVNDALQNVWCAPFEDDQFIVEPARITPAGGAVGTFQLMYEQVGLPTQADVYHVFQIGQVDPSYLNLIDTPNIWYSFTEIMRRKKMIANLYTEQGWMVPRFEAWVLSYGDNNLLIAVKDQKPFANFGAVPLYVRFYSNVWYNGESGVAAPGGVYTAGLRVASAAGAAGLQNVAATYVGYTGALQWYHNGYLVDSLVLTNISVGDSVEFVFDASVFKVLDLPIASLPQFVSTLDSTTKYLLHNGGGKRPTIDWMGDVDLYVLNGPGSGSYWGVYFHKNNAISMRQLTQQDYSIPTAFVQSYLDDNGWNGLTATVRLYLRQGGYANRPLTYENNRIFELYKLTDAEIIEAMVGTSANVPNWQAATLEASPYVTIMGEPSQLVTQSQVQAAYGYNAMSKLAGDNPILIGNTGYGIGAKLPVGLQNNSTVYEYDASRKLLGIYNHVTGAVYYPVSASCTFIEAIVGTGGVDSGIKYYQAPTTIALNPVIGQKVYLTNNFNGVPNSVWKDITGDTDFYTVSPDGLTGTFVIDTGDYFVAVKGDDKFLTYEFRSQSVDGTLIFHVHGNVTEKDGSTVDEIINIVPGKFDVWLNGNALVKDVDYYVQWPLFAITNTSFLDTQSTSQNITVRCTGFAYRSINLDGPGDSGFVKYNMLSRNGVFNIRDDRVVRVVAAGKVFALDELTYSEGDGIATLPVSVPNGSPYAIEEIVVPLRDLVNTDTYALRDASRAIDAAVSAYLSPKLPDPPETGPDVLTSPYVVFSTFMTKIISDVKADIISMANFQGLYSDTDVKNALTGYNEYLPFDPIWNGIDGNYVEVIPHPFPNPVVVSAYQYKFLLAVNRAFLGGQLNLSTYLQLSANGL